MKSNSYPNRLFALVISLLVMLAIYTIANTGNNAIMTPDIANANSGYPGVTETPEPYPIQA